MARSCGDLNVLINPREAQLRCLLKREFSRDPRVAARAAGIVAAVRRHGDAAVRRFTRRYDGCRLSELSVGDGEIRAAGDRLEMRLKRAIETARSNIRRFHAFYRDNEDSRIHTEPGVECFLRRLPIERVGLYVPGGGHPLFSSLLMLGVPALLAGCRDISVCTPPGPDGRVHPAILYCAGRLGIHRVFTVGGAQAVAALAWGTESIPRVDKIFGPGNDFVTAAKMEVARYGVAVDMPAGPSELLVVADGSAVPGFVAADLLGQLEHGRGSRAVLVSLDRELAEAVRAEIMARREAGQLPPPVQANLGNLPLLVVSDRARAVDILNGYAPEHLSLAVKNPQDWIADVRNAGSVFLGHWAACAVGDYVSGTNHTLPTGGFARAWSGVTLSAFQKTIAFQDLTAEGLRRVAPAAEALAAAEALPLHAASVARRRRCLADVPPARVSPLDFLSRRTRRATPETGGRLHPAAADELLLDANELPVPVAAGAPWNRYPDPMSADLVDRIALLEGWPRDGILMGNGSDELIELLVRGCCDPRGDRVLVTPPTYGMYAACANTHGVEVVTVPLTPGFQPDAAALIRCVREENVRLVFLASPNNPTGNLLDRDALRTVVEEAGCAVAVDEAYIDFSGDPGVARWVGEFPNLFVLRTFSKSWGAAGVRLGVLLGRSTALATLSRLRVPYTISVPNQAALAVILDNRERRDVVVREVVEQRENLAAELERLAVVDRVYPSRANFILAAFRRPAAVLGFLARAGIRVRDRSELPGCGGCLRISVGTAAENRRLVDRLKEMEGGQS